MSQVGKSSEISVSDPLYCLPDQGKNYQNSEFVFVSACLLPVVLRCCGGAAGERQNVGCLNPGNSNLCLHNSSLSYYQAIVSSSQPLSKLSMLSKAHRKRSRCRCKTLRQAASLQFTDAQITIVPTRSAGI